ncbi:MAG TPA: hypothetical protein VF800_06665 [Telluria sp.]|jgi:hypothetical protein
MSVPAKFLCFALGMAVQWSLALAGALPDQPQGMFSTVSSSAAVESEGLIQRGRDVLRSLGIRNQPVQKVDLKKTPKLLLTATGIDFDHTHLRLGDSMKRWKDVLKGKPRCSDEKPVPVMCVWDSLGIQLLTEGGKKDGVIQLAVHLSFDDNWWMDMGTEKPDGTPASPVVNWMPHHPFRGYLEVDGVGIDAETKLSSVLAGVKRERNFRCGFLDCTVARGLLGTMSLQAEPEGRTPQGVIRRLSVNAN